MGGSINLLFQKLSKERILNSDPFFQMLGLAMWMSLVNSTRFSGGEGENANLD
jgi:hypothetical protein